MSNVSAPEAACIAPRNQWYVAALSEELGRELFPRRILGEPVVMYRTVDGRPAALADACPHRWYPLSKGKLDGDNIRCGYHGITYDSCGAPIIESCLIHDKNMPLTRPTCFWE